MLQHQNDVPYYTPGPPTFDHFTRKILSANSTQITQNHTFLTTIQPSSFDKIYGQTNVFLRAAQCTPSHFGSYPFKNPYISSNNCLGGGRGSGLQLALCKKQHPLHPCSFFNFQNSIIYRYFCSVMSIKKHTPTNTPHPNLHPSSFPIYA
jgi:hypothetical protein